MEWKTGGLHRWRLYLKVDLTEMSIYYFSRRVTSIMTSAVSGNCTSDEDGHLCGKALCWDGPKSLHVIGAYRAGIHGR